MRDTVSFLYVGNLSLYLLLRTLSSRNVSGTEVDSLPNLSKFYSEVPLFSSYIVRHCLSTIWRMGASNRKHERLEPKHGKQLSTLSSRHVSGTEVDYHFAH